MAQAVERLDPITTEVIGNFILSAAEEMGYVLVRTAYSSNIKERADCSTAIFNASGETVAQASHIPVHLAAPLGLVRGILGNIPLNQIGQDDMFISNDPYQGVGSQLNDLTIAAPVFADGKLVAFVANIAHHSDVGGRFPGSESGACRHVFEEGLRLPIMKIMESGQLRKEVVDLVALNSRVPRERVGDLKAQIAANRTGVRRMQELCDKYGASAVVAHMLEWLNYSERRIREAIGQLRQGVYFARDVIERYPEGTDEIALHLHVNERSLVFDFSGTAQQGENSFNVVLDALLASVYYAIKAFLDPSIPPNAGYYRPIQVIAPPGSIVHATPPAAVSSRVHTCQRVVDTIFTALASAKPDTGLAGCASSKLTIISGIDPDKHEQFVSYESVAGGLGARSSKDGLDACRAHVTNSSNLPIESLEREYPIRVERYELLQDSGGPGRFRGGLGVLRDLRLLTDAEHSGWGLGHKFPGCGLFGGMRGRLPGPGMLVRNIRTPLEEVLDPSSHFRLQSGDLLTVLTPGGGGFGSPMERDPEAVLADVLSGKVSVDGARSDYGVEIAQGKVDYRQTAVERGRHENEA